MHKLKKLKTKSCMRLIHSLLFIFSLMIDSLIKQQTAYNADNWPLKIYIQIISIIPISIQVLIQDLIFPVYKIDREQSWEKCF